MIENLNKCIDHTLLKANATKSEIENLCEQAKEYNFFSVCVNPINVKLAKELLEQTQVKVCTVVGFPLGQNEMTTKMFEAQMAVENGADEIDMVINVAKLIDGDYDYVEQEIETYKPDVIYSCGPHIVLQKISETSQKYNIPCYVALEKVMACSIGVCRGCVIKLQKNGKIVNASVCQDGPVFKGDEIVWQ